jgi:hypothetical protein
MWSITSVDAKPMKFDFRSSEQGQPTYTSLYAGNRRIVNAADRVDFDPEIDCIQVEVCEDCGFTQCAPGGWVSLRRLGSNVLWIPAFEAISSDHRPDEFQPPVYVRDLGVPSFDETAYAQVRQHISALPASENIRVLSSREAALILQWEAPGRVLGKFPEPLSLRRDRFVAVDYGDLEENIAALSALLGKAYAKPCNLILLPEGAQRTFYLDLPGHPAWAPLAEHDNGLALRLSGNLNVIVSEGSA